MIVLHLTDCPNSLKGDLTKWLFEIASGVYVGQVSARVRDKLWERVFFTLKHGRAVMVYSTNNEQGLDFRIAGDTWEPIDFDGLNLMLRPTPARLQEKYKKQDLKLGFSNAAKRLAAKKYGRRN
jgi:CRISPR-associated protein Cas2